MTGSREKHRNTWRIGICLAVFALLTAGISRAAQEDPGGPRGTGGSPLASPENPGKQEKLDQEAASALAIKIEARKKVLVDTDSGREILKRPLVLPEGLAPRSPGGGPELSRLILWQDVRIVKVRRSGALHGAIWGGSVGGALGLLLGLAATRPCEGCFDLLCGADFGDVLLLTAGSAALCALPAALIGALVGKWSTVYPAPGKGGKGPAVSILPTPKGGAAVIVSLSL